MIWQEFSGFQLYSYLIEARSTRENDYGGKK